MNTSVGLVSTTSFRVPKPGLDVVFGPARCGAPGARDDAARSVADAADEVELLKTELASSIISEQEAYTSLHRLEVQVLDRPSVPQAETATLASVTPISAATDGGAPAATVASREADLDAWWDALCGNDPEVVLHHLTTVFATSPLSAAPVRLRGRVLDLAVLIPAQHLLPRQTVGLYGGQLSIRTASAAHLAWLHRQVVAGLALAAARQALASAPGVSCVRVHALSAEHRGHHDDVSAMAVVQLDRDAVERADLTLDAETLLILHGRGLLWQTGGLHTSLQALPLSDIPTLAPLLARLCQTAAAAPA